MTPPATCSHCGTPLTGPYCSACGQEVRTTRLTTPAVLRQGVAELFDLDAGLLPTLRGLIVAPERVVVGWWEGHTRPWVHPARWVLLTFALAQFVTWRTGALADLAAGWVEGSGAASPDYEAAVVELLTDYFLLFAAGGLVLPVLVAALLGRRTLAEQVVFAAFVFGELALVGSVLLAAGWLVPAIPGAEVLVLLTPFYLGWAIRRVFRTGVMRTVLATVALLVGSMAGSTLIAGVIDGATRGAG